MAEAAPEASLLSALCTPGAPASGPESLAASLLMWSAMSLAMMLPTAAPMISVYLDIAEAAQARRKTVVDAGVLAAGYAAVWLAVSLAAALLQAGLRRAGMPATESPQSLLVAGAVLMAAGAYQFTPLKDACLSKCQRPMPFFLASWSGHPAGVFRLGLRQGVWCLGCCWALMLAMFASGLMNLVWMAGLGVVMMAEKLYAESRALTWGAGLLFLAGGAAIAGLGLAG
jgi:predicted metal-binding membrane protein